jgi:PEP-CTERM motif-containing protein
MRIRQLLVAVLMAIAPILAFGVDNDDDINTVPEPSALALLAIGAAALIISRANKRK